MAASMDPGDGSSFDINLAPMLDIIVSIIPMLLMSVVFVQLAIIETPVPQAVQKAIENNENRQDQAQITLKVAKTKFTVVVTYKDKSSEHVIDANAGKLDFEKLHTAAADIKRQYPDVFKVELHPEGEIPLSDLVLTMDQIRSAKKGEPEFKFNDVETGKPISTNLMFPDIVFGNVTGG